MVSGAWDRHGKNHPTWTQLDTTFTASDDMIPEFICVARRITLKGSLPFTILACSVIYEAFCQAIVLSGYNINLNVCTVLWNCCNINRHFVEYRNSRSKVINGRHFDLFNNHTCPSEHVNHLAPFIWKTITYYPVSYPLDLIPLSLRFARSNHKDIIQESSG